MPGGDWTGMPARGQRRRLLGPAHLSQRGGDAARRRPRLRPDGRGRSPRRARARRQLGLPLGRRAGGAVRRPPRSDLGGAAGPLAAPLRHRAGPGAARRIRLARRATPAASASSSATPGSRGTTASSPGPPPCSAAGESGGLGSAAGPGDPDGAAGRAGLPSFVPARYREPILRSAARWNVSGALLAAQLMAESGFDAGAVSPAGAQGIAQFMPGTAASYGLRDPFDPEAAIDAQAHLMSDLLRAVPLGSARPGRLQRRARCGQRPAPAPVPTRRPAPTSPASSPCSTAPAPRWRRRSRCGWSSSRGPGPGQPMVAVTPRPQEKKP